MMELTRAERVSGCAYGAAIADALAMPVHYYYETDKLREDYGRVTDYLPPRNPHRDSFMDQASYRAPNRRGEILHDQAPFWGKKGIHYHQFLAPGENTLNVSLANLVSSGLREDGRYDLEKQISRYIEFMTKPGNHRDTYIDGWHQFYFIQYAQGRHPLHCAKEDNHIGGLATILPILCHYHDNPEAGRLASMQHLRLTHLGEPIKQAAGFVQEMLTDLFEGVSIETALDRRIGRHPLLRHPLKELLSNEDSEIIGGKFKTAGYVEHALPSVVYLALKYGADPEKAVIANTNLGGDNCLRGVILGALLGAAHGTRAWPERWVHGLKSPPNPADTTAVN